MIDLAVVTGAKSHDVIGFHHLFRSFDGIDSYIQHIDDFASAPQAVRDSYDVVLFYFMMPDGPPDDGLPGYRGQPKSTIEHLLQTGQGIVILHHALLAYPQWSTWSDIVGIADRTLVRYRHDEQIPLTISDKDHPITRGLADWTIVDETYLMAGAAGDNHILLTTDHNESTETIAWVHRYQESKIFCLQLGHDRQAWEDENFRSLLRRGIEWSVA